MNIHKYPYNQIVTRNGVFTVDFGFSTMTNADRTNNTWFEANPGKLALEGPLWCDVTSCSRVPDFLFKPCPEASRTLTLDPELSRQLITLLSDRDNPGSVNKAIDLILSLCPDRDAAELICHLQYVDDTGRVVPMRKPACRPRLSRRTDWLCDRRRVEDISSQHGLQRLS